METTRKDTCELQTPTVGEAKMVEACDKFCATDGKQLSLPLLLGNTAYGFNQAAMADICTVEYYHLGHVLEVFLKVFWMYLFCLYPGKTYAKRRCFPNAGKTWRCSGVAPSVLNIIRPVVTASPPGSEPGSAKTAWPPGSQILLGTP